MGVVKIKRDEEKQDLILENNQLKREVQKLQDSLKKANSDINYFKKAEISLKENEGNLSLINDNMVDVIGQVDINGNLIYATASLESVTGYTLDELIGKSIFNEIHPEDKDAVLKEFKKIFSPTGKGIVVQYRYKHANGNYTCLETTSKAFFKENVLLGATFSTRNISYRKKIENQLKKALEDKNTLIQDIHHRVKNNMQIISSLLSLQEQWIEDETSLKLLYESQSRIKTMALIYQKMYQSNNISAIELKSYVHSLVSELLSAAGVENYITANLKVDDIELNIIHAIPLALIINELVTNSIKYAFPNQEKAIIKIMIQRNIGGKREYIMVIADNGVGMSSDVDLDNPSTLGLQLVQNLARQLDGEVVIEGTDGVVVTLTFNDNDDY